VITHARPLDPRLGACKGTPWHWLGCLMCRTNLPVQNHSYSRQNAMEKVEIIHVLRTWHGSPACRLQQDPKSWDFGQSHSVNPTSHAHFIGLCPRQQQRHSAACRRGTLSCTARKANPPKQQKRGSLEMPGAQERRWTGQQRRRHPVRLVLWVGNGTDGRTLACCPPVAASQLVSCGSGGANGYERRRITDSVRLCLVRCNSSPASHLPTALSGRVRRPAPDGGGENATTIEPFLRRGSGRLRSTSSLSSREETGLPEQGVSGRSQLSFER
jgi:hypothetical protein